MGQWRFFDEGKVPYYSELSFFQGAPHVPTEHQVGHNERTFLCSEMIKRFGRPDLTLSDMGCGDGTFLVAIRGYVSDSWGYDAGVENVAKAVQLGAHVQQADILNDILRYGDITSCCEVLEHLYDPATFIRKIPSQYVLFSSPSAERPDWHYIEHAWGWDMDGYRELIESCGFRVIDHRNIIARGTVNFFDNGDSRHPEFQAILAERIQ